LRSRSMCIAQTGETNSNTNNHLSYEILVLVIICD
jgi:hypothetical protein